MFDRITGFPEDKVQARSTHLNPLLIGTLVLLHPLNLPLLARHVIKQMKALKGRDIPAQGNALWNGAKTTSPEGA